MSSKLDDLVIKLLEKDYLPEVTQSKVAFSVEPSKHPEWSSYYLQVRDSPLFGDYDFRFREETRCEIYFEDGKVKGIAYREILPDLSFSFDLSLSPGARQILESVGKVIDFDLLSP